MLQNTRGRTVFAFQPKRLPKDVDRLAAKFPCEIVGTPLNRLTFFKGSIVRKKSLGFQQLWGRLDGFQQSHHVWEAQQGCRRMMLKPRRPCVSIQDSLSLHSSIKILPVRSVRWKPSRLSHRRAGWRPDGNGLVEVLCC